MTDWLCFTSAQNFMLPRPVKAYKSNLETFKKNKSHDVLGSSKEKDKTSMSRTGAKHSAKLTNSSKWFFAAYHLAARPSSFASPVHLGSLIP